MEKYNTATNRKKKLCYILQANSQDYCSYAGCGETSRSIVPSSTPRRAGAAIQGK